MKFRTVIFLFTAILASTVLFYGISTAQESLISFPGANTSLHPLDNGLTFILKQDHRTPTFAAVLFIKTGSATESEYTGSGITHFIEHLIFKGTSTRNALEVERQIKLLGADIGAYTTFDYTAFKIQGPADNILQLLDIFHDIIANPAFDEGEIKNEKNVVINEMRLTQDDPQKYLSRQFWQTTYLMHPYRNPIIGHKKIFENLTRDEIVDYYSRFYIPDNMVLAISGDINIQAVSDKATQTFGNLKRKPIPAPTRQREPEQNTQRYKEFSYSVSKMYMTIGFHSVSLADRDLYALDTLAILLGEGKSSILYQSLRNRLELVHSISAYNYTPFDPGLFIITSTLEPENKEKVMQQILDEIDVVKRSPFKQKELDKAKNQVISSYIFSKQSQESQADDLGVSQLLAGDMDFSKRYIEGVSAVTSHDIIDAAKKYLRKDNMTTVVLIPPDDKKIESKPPERIDAVRAVSERHLRSGVRVLLAEDKNLPIVSLRVCMKAGLRTEDKENNGISNLTAEMLTKGTRSRSEEQLFTEIESLGGSISTYSANNSLGISLDVMSKDFEKGLELLSDVVMHSSFPRDRLRILKGNTLAYIALMNDDIFIRTEKGLRKGLFSSHPYSMLSIGTPDSVAKISRRDIIEFYRRYFVGPNIVISVCGDIDSDKAYRLISARFKGIKKKNLPAMTNASLEEITERININEKMDKKQAVVMIGFRSVGISHPDRYPLQILSSIFSGGAGRLYANIRQEQGLAYTLGTFGMTGIDAGSFIFYAATAPENVDEVRDEMFSQISKVINGELAEEEIDSAKKNLISKHQINLQTAGEFALKTGLDELYGLGYDNYLAYSANLGKVSREEIIQVANRYFTLNNCVISTTVPGDK
ncbi:MAG: pitrilysin family protein [Candidatus Omnitrophota bacterium]